MKPSNQGIEALIDHSAPCAHQPTSDRPRPGPVTRVFVAVIHGYQLARTGRPTGCRFTPSCSSYAVEAVEHLGLWSGGRLALRRLLRCHPWGGSGFDPVPDRRTA